MEPERSTKPSLRIFLHQNSMVDWSWSEPLVRPCFATAPPLTPFSNTAATTASPPPPVALTSTGLKPLPVCVLNHAWYSPMGIPWMATKEDEGSLTQTAE